jgi:phosphopantothenoylcysteine decarboxylase/phosphopantothenate--cysteine ligase
MRKKARILITAGPTREALDPVRYISNHSTGKMGYSITQSFLEAGHEVVLVSGPVQTKLTHPNLTLVKVNSAGEMHEACCQYYDSIEVAVFCAAVADYRPEFFSDRKIKKDDDEFIVRLVRNIDIASEFGKRKKPGQISVGFALETHDELFNAQSKLAKKNFDMIVLNSMQDKNATFGFDTNKITIIHRDKSIQSFPLKDKTDVAEDIRKSIYDIMYAPVQD